MPERIWHATLVKLRRLAWFIAVVGLLVNSLDCYGASLISKQARDCCNSGHCSPANHDPCCKSAPSGAGHLLLGQQKVHVEPLVVTIAVLSPFAATFLRDDPAYRVMPPPDISPPFEIGNNSLPLLI